jgi:antirestriction protein ArdC
MLSILKSIDNFFCEIEGKAKRTTLNGSNSQPKANNQRPKAKHQQPAAKTSKPRVNSQKQTLGSILYNLFVSKEYKDQGLDGWREDKEKFKVDLINDIKTFLFTKWEKPWKAGLIFDENGKLLSGFRNMSGRVYKNESNVMSLSRKSGDSPFFITLSKLNKMGGKILDKLKAVWVISYIPIYKDVKLSGEEDKGRSPDFMLPKFHQVINVDFVEGIEKPAYKTVEFKKLELNEYVEAFVNELKRLKRLPKLHYDQSDKCFYKHKLIGWGDDSIHLVPINNFKNINGYYSVLFHEITHSTMNPKRCGRGKHKNAKLDYANEELVAEMGAMIICEELGLKYQRQNSLTYLNGWLKQAKGSDIDSALIEAYAYACDAAEYLLDGIDLTKLVPKTLAKRAEEQDGEETETEVENVKKTEPEPQSILPRTSPDELSYELARRAHMGTSFSPEKRAKSHQESYANELNKYAEQFEALIKSDEQKGIAIEEFERFKKGYTDKYNAWLRAKSNCLSSMITGPSKFPTRKAEKANQTENNRLNEFLEWEKKAVKAVEARIKGKTPQDIVDTERWEKLKREVIERLATIVEIEQGKAPYSKPLIVAALKRYIMAAYKARYFSDFNKALELVKEAQEKFKMTVFAPNNPIWKLQPIAEAEPENKEPETIYKAEGCEVVNNYQAQRVQMAFNGKPAAEVIAMLKKRAFKWSPSQKVWQRQNTTNGINAALAIAKMFFSSNEPTPESDKPTTKPKQQTLTNPIDIFIHKAGSSFRGIPAAEIKALLGALERLKKTDDWDKFKEDGIMDLLEFTESEEQTLGIPENYDSKKQPKTSLLTTRNYFGDLKLSEVGEAIFAAYEKFASKKANLTPVNTGQLMLFGTGDVNEQFNTELDLLIQGKLPKNHVFYIGDMSDILNALSIKILPIEMQANRLYKKANQKNHLFELSLLKNLPEKLNNPVMVFKSKTVKGSLVVLIELTSNDNNFVVAIEIGKLITKWSKGDVRINDVRSIYPKDTISDVLNWIEKDGLLLWVNKKKALDLLVRWRSNYAKATQQIKGCTNIIQNFNNPTPTPNNLNGENNNLFGLQPISSTKKGKTYRIKGDLGQFLGEYDRNNYTIVLRGDKGAGKSRLLYQLINAFAGKQLRVAFLSLEMANNSSITQRYKSEYITNANLKRIDITDQAPTYDDLNAICKGYDVVAIDSWTKLKGITQQDFDRLQKENPSTIIICIFQSTTGKITRGGNMPEYDAGTVIQVNKGGLAECEKNRYAPTDKIYNVFTKSLEPTEEPENV